MRARLRRFAFPLITVACHAPPGSPVATPVVAPREIFSAFHLGALRIEGAPPIDHAIERDLAPYGDVRSSRLLDVSSDGTHVLALVAGDLVELPEHRLVTDLAVDWARYGSADSIAFTADDEGDEVTWLHISTSSRRDVVVASGRVVEPIWDRARDRYVFGVTSPDGERTDLVVWSHDLPARVVFSGDGEWSPLDVSADGQTILARHERSSTESALYRIELEPTPIAVAVTPVGGAAVVGGRFAPDGSIYAIGDAGSDRMRLLLITSRKTAALTDGTVDVTAFAIAGDGSLGYVAARDGESTLHVLGRDGDRVVGPRGGVIGDLVAAGSVLGFSFTDPTHPRAAYTYELAGDRLVAWSIARPPAGLVAPARAQVTAADGLQLPMFVYRPLRPGAVPVIIDLHGGPEDQWLPSYQGFVQFLVARGYAVIQPNVRGSAGQGRAFAKLDDREHREAAVRDVGSVLDWIARDPALDRTRMCVMGTSYGGFLALAALRELPELRAAITLGAITDFVGFLAGTAPYRRDHRRLEYGDERDPAMRAVLAQISPLTHASELRRPLLVAHGTRDPRVPPANAEALVQAARIAGSPVWSVAAADEGHLFARSENRAVFEVLVAQFLTRFVPASPR